MNMVLAPYALGAAALSLTLGRAIERLKLSRAKHRSLAGHARIARRMAFGTEPAGKSNLVWAK